MNVCDRCGASDFFMRKKGNAVGLYCSSCEKWVKWVGKNDVAKYTRSGLKVYSEDYSTVKHDAVKQNTDLGVVTVTKQVDSSTHAEVCKTCLTGVYEQLDIKSDISAIIFDKVLLVKGKKNDTIYASFNVNYCPECGRKLT